MTTVVNIAMVTHDGVDDDKRHSMDRKANAPSPSGFVSFPPPNIRRVRPTTEGMTTAQLARASALRSDDDGTPRVFRSHARHDVNEPNAYDGYHLDNTVRLAAPMYGLPGYKTRVEPLSEAEVKKDLRKMEINYVSKEEIKKQAIERKDNAEKAKKKDKEKARHAKMKEEWYRAQAQRDRAHTCGNAEDPGSGNDETASQTKSDSSVDCQVECEHFGDADSADEGSGTENGADGADKSDEDEEAGDNQEGSDDSEAEEDGDAMNPDVLAMTPAERRKLKKEVRAMQLRDTVYPGLKRLIK